MKLAAHNRIIGALKALTGVHVLAMIMVCAMLLSGYGPVSAAQSQSHDLGHLAQTHLPQESDHQSDRQISTNNLAVNNASHGHNHEDEAHDAAGERSVMAQTSPLVLSLDIGVDHHKVGDHLHDLPAFIGLGAAKFSGPDCLWHPSCQLRLSGLAAPNLLRPPIS